MVNGIQLHSQFNVLVHAQVEKMFQEGRSTSAPSNTYPQAKKDLELDLVSFVKAQAQGL